MTRKKDDVDKYFEEKEKEQPLQPNEIRVNNEGMITERGEEEDKKKKS